MTTISAALSLFEQQLELEGSFLLIQVSAMIGNLRNMASDMNGELENQNQQLDRINLKASSDITRVKMANDKAAALMK